MEESGGQLIQFAVAMLSAVLLFLAASALHEKFSLTILILLLPFQLITSRYGGMNVMLIYLISAAFLLRGRFVYKPFALGFIAILMVYLISMSQAHRSTWFDHATYIIGFGSNVLAFYLLYNYARREQNWNGIWKVLLWLNVLVLVYSTIQLTAGFGRLSAFGVSEFSIIQNREDQRLVGPFQATAITAEYLVIQVLMLAYAFLNSPRLASRLLYIGLIGANCFFLVTTGNRGGLISLIIGSLGFLILFRRELGMIRSMAIMTMIAIIFSVTASIAIQYTQFNQLFVRLEQTQVEGLIPDSRQRAWPMALEGIAEKPLVGHGPRLRLIEEERRRIPGHEYMGYPHSAYLHLLYTIGFLGLVAYAALIAMIGFRLFRAARNTSKQPIIHGLPRLGLLILFVVLISEIRIEMFRFILFDYQNIIFAIFGIFVGFADALYQNSRSPVAKTQKRKPLGMYTPGYAVKNGAGADPAVPSAPRSAHS